MGPRQLGSNDLNTSLSLLREGRNESQVSLSVNYIPSKFSSVALPSGVRKRKSAKSTTTQGLDEFDAQRFSEYMENDEPKEGGRMRWNRFKWALFVTNTLLTLYSLVSLVFCLLIWFNIFTHADVLRVGNRSELIVSTIAAGCGLLTCIIGWAGILLNNRSFLALYTFFLWITFTFLVVPGYISFRTREYNLEGKINAQWSQDLGADGRARIQNQLLCCGYFSPFVEATVTQTCYARSVLPGCKEVYMDFEKLVLERWYTVAFSLVPVHIGVMVAGLLCSNHVTYRFGKGMMPKAYRMSEKTMRALMDSYKNQRLAQYGSDPASTSSEGAKASGSSSPGTYPPADTPTTSINLKSRFYFPQSSIPEDRDGGRNVPPKRASQSQAPSSASKQRDWHLPFQTEEFAKSPEAWSRSPSDVVGRSGDAQWVPYDDRDQPRVNSATLNFYGYSRSGPGPNTAGTNTPYPFAQEYQPQSSTRRNFF